MENEKDLKFICRDIPIDFTSNITYEFEQLKECLKSEKVDLNIRDVYKFFDIFLRLTGLGRSGNDEELFQGILAQCAPVQCRDISDKFENAEILENFKNAVISAEKLSDDPFNDIDTVIANVPILMKECAIFWNDIITHAIRKVKESKCTSYTLETYIPSNVSRMIKLSVFDDKNGVGLSVVIFSTVNSMALPDKVSIVVDTYPKEIADKILGKNEEEKDE